MCVILVKETGVELPENLVRQSIEDNPHGWGIAQAINGKLVISKGMKEKEYIDKVLDIPLNEQAIIHTRYSTKGRNDTMNCHPFKISKDVCMMHNGTIDIVRPYSEMSDTWHFAFGILRPLLERNPKIYDTDAFQRLISHAISSQNTNKVVMMNRFGKIVIANKHLGIEYKGLWLSNDRSCWGHHFGTRSPKENGNNFSDKICNFRTGPQHHGGNAITNVRYNGVCC